MTLQPLAPRTSIQAIAPGIPSKMRYLNRDEIYSGSKQNRQSASTIGVRRERPCDNCTRRKSKCIIQDSKRCISCDFYKQSCTFVESAQPRKRKADGSSAAERAVKRATPSSTSSSAPSSPKRLLAAPYQSDSVLPRSPPPVDKSLGRQQDHYCKYLGPTTTLDASLIGFGAFDDRNETASVTGTLRQVSDTEFFSVHADADVSLLDQETRALDEIEATVGEYGLALINIYSRKVHPIYPILQKNALSGRKKHGNRQCSASLLAAMYLLALQWWSSEPELSRHAKPDVHRLEQIAFTSLTVAMQRPKISVVQAGLLLSQRSKSCTWMLTVQLVALGQDIGLHLDCSEWSIPLWERRLRKRLAWALYMQDKWSALVHGRPSHINTEDWAVPLLTEDDFDDGAYPAGDDNVTNDKDGQDQTSFMQLIALTNIMSEVCNTFYSQRAKADFARVSGHAQMQLVLSRAKPVQVKLKEWYSQLPVECKMDPFSPGTLSRNGYLHLAYFATEITIHRRIIQSLDPTTSDPYMMYICRSAAKTRLIGAMDFVNRLRPAHLDAFWYFASTSNFALIGTFGALLAATSPAKEEAQFYQSRLREFRWTLSVSAKKAVWINGAVEMLDASLELLKGKPEKSSAEELQRWMTVTRPAGSTEEREMTRNQNGYPQSEQDDENSQDEDVDAWNDH